LFSIANTWYTGESGWSAAQCNQGSSLAKIDNDKKHTQSVSIKRLSNSTDLPEGWHAADDPASGKTYYYNSHGHSQWEKPNPQQAKAEAAPTARAKPATPASKAEAAPTAQAKPATPASKAKATPETSKIDLIARLMSESKAHGKRQR